MSFLCLQLWDDFHAQSFQLVTRPAHPAVQAVEGSGETTTAAAVWLAAVCPAVWCPAAKL